MQSRNVISIALFILLLIYGPIYDWTGGMIVRISYLIILPSGLWFLLGWLWDKFYIDHDKDQIIERITYGLIGLFLILQGILAFIAKDHIDNTKWIYTRDGYEAVGDDILVQGPDYVISFALIILGLFVVFGLALPGKKNNKQDGSR